MQNQWGQSPAMTGAVFISDHLVIKLEQGGIGFKLRAVLSQITERFALECLLLWITSIMTRGVGNMG